MNYKKHEVSLQIYHKRINECHNKSNKRRPTDNKIEATLDNLNFDVDYGE